MKKVLALIIALAMCISLAACSAPATAAGGDAKASSDGFSVDVFIFNFADTYTASVRDSMTKSFEADGINYTFYDAADNQGTQTNQIETALSKGTDCLVVQIVTTGSEEAAMNIVNMAKEKDVPVIFFNREVSNEVVNSYEKCAFVGTDADEAGYMQGEMIAELLKTDFDKYDLNGDGNISYIMLKGELGNAEADGRTQYSVEEADRLLDEAGLGTLVYYDPNNSDKFQPCNWDAALGQEAMITALGTNPMDGDAPIEMVISNCDDMATGAIEALNEVGYNKGSDPMIPVFGVDATDVAVQDIADGKMTGTVLQDAVGMADCIVKLCGNVKAGSKLLDGTDSYIIDENCAKFRIPYGVYTGK